MKGDSTGPTIHSHCTVAMPRGGFGFPYTIALKERNEARERESLTNPGHLRTRGLAQRVRESAQSPKKKKKKKESTSNPLVTAPFLMD